MFGIAFLFQKEINFRVYCNIVEFCNWSIQKMLQNEKQTLSCNVYQRHHMIMYKLSESKNKLYYKCLKLKYLSRRNVSKDDSVTLFSPKRTHFRHHFSSQTYPLQPQTYPLQPPLHHSVLIYIRIYPTNRHYSKRNTLT